ncbi:HEAT repeat domain-containing protein [Geoalkalibacter sp.]|uniref:HEAT repeat domain-containing protein n=1 Tax=Geoalkalibacter sp. TaxID=3041440 RepID=UPI00272E0301|nr:HEAT repeat domain-containing protein [Geoalkalibacter sp.]
METQLRSSNEEERIEALRRIRQQDLPLSMAALGQALGDPSWRVRKEAVACFLAGAHRRWAAEDAIALLHSEDNAGLRNAAMEALVGLGPSAVPALKAEMSCADVDVRKFVLDILGEIGDEVSIGTLVDALRDPDINVATAAVENLGKLRAREAIPALLAAMEKNDFSWRFTLLEALAQIGERIALAPLAAFRQDRLLRKALFDCLGSVGDRDAIALLVEGLGDDMRKCREAAALALVRLAENFGAEVRDGLSRQAQTTLATTVADLLQSRDRSVQESAVRILGWIGDSSAAQRLLPMLADEAFGARVYEALMGMGSEVVCDLVKHNLGQNPELDAYLVYLAGESRCLDLGAQLACGLKSADVQMRLVTARTLGKIGGVEVVEALLDALDDGFEEVRDAAANALAAIGRKDPTRVLGKIAPLVEATRDVVRGSAVKVLGEIGDVSSRPYLSMAFKDASPAVRQAAVRALASCGGDDMVADLKLALTDENSEVRALAAENLGMARDADVVDILGLALGDEDIWVRTHAVRSLSRIGGERARALLHGAVQDPVGLVAIAALEALVEVDPRQAQDALLEALDHPDEEVVKTALQCLGRLEAGAWVPRVASKMINHPQWGVRLALTSMLQSQDSPEVLSLLEARLSIEGDELVRQALEALLSRSAGSKNKGMGR